VSAREFCMEHAHCAHVTVNDSSACACDICMCVSMHVLCVKSSVKENCFQFQLLPAFVAQRAPNDKSNVICKEI